jgi:hypothetical protein
MIAPVRCISHLPVEGFFILSGDMPVEDMPVRGHARAIINAGQLPFMIAHVRDGSAAADEWHANMAPQR